MICHLFNRVLNSIRQQGQLWAFCSYIDVDILQLSEMRVIKGAEV